MNTLPPASVPATSSSAQALSNSSSTSSSNASDSASANAASSDTSTSGNFHQVLNQQMAQNNGSASDTKSAPAQAAPAPAPAPAGASNAASKSPKSTRTSTTTQAADTAGSSPSSDLSAQQAAAISAAATQAAQTAQSANQGDAPDSATAAVAGNASLSNQLARAELGSSSVTANQAESEDVLPAGDTGKEATNAGPGGVSGAMDESGQQHMLTSMGGKGDSDGADLSGGAGSAATGASFSAASVASSNTATAFLMTQRAAVTSEQSLFSSAADKTHDSSDIPTAGSSDATLAAAQVSTSQVAAAVPGSTGSTVASASVPYQMGSDAWRADVSSHVLYFSQQDISSAELHLNPAHLSPLNISISVDNNQTSIAFNAAHEATRQAMQDSLPQLREMFQAHGIALGQTTVGDSSAGTSQQQNQNSARAGNTSLASKALESSSTAVNGSSGVRLRSLQIVDTFA